MVTTLTTLIFYNEKWQLFTGTATRVLNLLGIWNCLYGGLLGFMSPLGLNLLARMFVFPQVTRSVNYQRDCLLSFWLFIIDFDSKTDWLIHTLTPSAYDCLLIDNWMSQNQNCTTQWIISLHLHMYIGLHCWCVHMQPIYYLDGWRISCRQRRLQLNQSYQSMPLLTTYYQGVIEEGGCTLAIDIVVSRLAIGF